MVSGTEPVLGAWWTPEFGWLFLSKESEGPGRKDPESW